MSRSLPDVVAEYRALRHGVGAHQLTRDVLSVSGVDAATYLQGQCSQDVEGLAIGGTADALLLSPQGKVDAFIRVTRTSGDAFIIDADAGCGAIVDARLKRFRIRVDAEIESRRWSCVAIRGPQATGSAGSVPAGVLCLPVAWPGLSGFDLLGPPPAVGSAVDAWVDRQVLRCGDAAWDAARIEAGVPVNGQELTEATIAAEAGLVDRTVSFTKGCFTGQELVARIDARGSKVARRLTGLVLDNGSAAGVGSGGQRDLPPLGAGVFVDGGPDGDGDFEVGHLTSVAWSPGLDAAVGLATLQRRVTPPAPVTIRWVADGGPCQATAEARALPLVG